jgi:hypothetical protein
MLDSGGIGVPPPADAGVPPPADAGASPPADAGVPPPVPKDAEVQHDAATSQDAEIVDAAPPVEPTDAGRGDAELAEPDASNDAGFDECIDGTVEMVPCGRRVLSRRCVDGQWREPSCMQDPRGRDAGSAAN